MLIAATEYIGPGFKWRVVRRERHIETVNDVGVYPNRTHRIRRKTKLNNARLVVRVKKLKKLRYAVREVYHELTSDKELAILNYPAPLAFKRLDDAIEAGFLLTRSTDIKQARATVEAKRQDWKV